MRKLKVTELQRINIEEFKESTKLPVVIVLDDIRSLHNVGSVFRTADAFRIEKVILCGITACPPSAEIHKTALGAEDSVSWIYRKDTLDAVSELQDEGYKVYSIEQAVGSDKLDSFVCETKTKYALIMGNEVKGVRQDVVDKSDGCIEIRQYGTKHSMNVSVTAGIVMWEFSRQLTGML